MMRVFAFTEQETKQLAEIMADCQDVAHYDALVKSFFAQIKDGLRIVANCPTPTDTTDTTDTKKPERTQHHENSRHDD